jgi:hypothetical protein
VCFAVGRHCLTHALHDQVSGTNFELPLAAEQVRVKLHFPTGSLVRTLLCSADDTVYDLGTTARGACVPCVTRWASAKGANLRLFQLTCHDALDSILSVSLFFLSASCSMDTNSTIRTALYQWRLVCQASRSGRQWTSPVRSVTIWSRYAGTPLISARTWAKRLQTRALRPNAFSSAHTRYVALPVTRGTFSTSTSS